MKEEVMLAKELNIPIVPKTPETERDLEALALGGETSKCWLEPSKIFNRGIIF